MTSNYGIKRSLTLNHLDSMFVFSPFPRRILEFQPVPADKRWRYHAKIASVSLQIGLRRSFVSLVTKKHLDLSSTIGSGFKCLDLISPKKIGEDSDV